MEVIPKKFQVLTALLVLLLAPAAAWAKTFTVTRSFDLGSDGICDSLCTIREAINAANSNPGADIVRFASFMSGAVMELRNGPLVISGPLTIVGPGSNRLAAVPDASDPALPYRVLFVDTAVGEDVTISGIAFGNGEASGPDPDDDLGGVLFHQDADLVLRDVLVTGGSADLEGGGIFSRDGSLVIEDSVVGSGIIGGDAIPGNSAATGGGIFFESSNPAALLGLTIRRTTIRDNESTVDDGGGLYIGMVDGGVLIENSRLNDNDSAGVGGGIASIGSDDEGRVTIRNSSITANGSGTSGGGLAVGLPGGPVFLENVTLSGNDATAGGGGIHASDTNGLLQLRGVTVAGNTTPGTGGGIQSTDTEPLLLLNTIVGGNTATTMDNDLSAAKFFAQATVLEDEGNAANGGGFYIKASPQLEDLADYGGPTLTHALAKGSPAVDTGDNAVCAVLDSNKDQRGQLRTVDGDSDGSKNCDIGAFEFNGRTVDCEPAPMVGCPVFATGSILLSNLTGTASDSMSLALTRGTTPTTTYFGDPTHFNGTANAVCIYANGTSMGPVDTLVGSLNIPAGERNTAGTTLWKLLTGGKTSYAFATGNTDGVKTMRQTPSMTGVAAITVTASGSKLTLPDIPRRAPTNVEVLVQNQTSDGECAEISFTGAEIKTFTFTRFYAVDSTP